MKLLFLFWRLAGVVVVAVMSYKWIEVRLEISSVLAAIWWGWFAGILSFFCCVAFVWVAVTCGGTPLFFLLFSCLPSDPISKYNISVVVLLFGQQFVLLFWMIKVV